MFVKTDSKLVIGNVDKTFEAKGDRMKHYLEVAQTMNKAISGITIQHLLNGENEEAC